MKAVAQRRPARDAMAQKRILIVNKFLYPRGGDCIVALSEAELLRRAGYDVEMWGMDYPDNLDMPLADTFASRVEFEGGLREKMRAAGRMMGMGDIRRSFAEVLRRFRPDTVHFHNIHSYLSPVIVGMAKEAGCRTLWTMHDYKLVCPAYLCLDPKGNPCTACIHHPAEVASRRCMKGSAAASAMAYAESLRWPVGRLVRYTDIFICPSAFMASLLASAGVPLEKTRVICNFLDPAKEQLLKTMDAEASRRKDLLLYVGRLSKEKGVEALVDTVASMPEKLTLRLYGGGPLENDLRQRFGRAEGIEFMGYADAATIAHALSEAETTICPSLCFDNNPLSVIESLSAGTPVLGSDMGGIPELITPQSGMLYDPHDTDALAGALRGMFVRSWDHAAIKAEALARFSESAHIHLLEQIL